MWTGVLLLGVAFGQPPGADQADVAGQVRLLQQQNEALQSQLQQQQSVIDALRRDVAEIRGAGVQGESGMGRSKGDVDDAGAGSSSDEQRNFGKVRLSGEGGVAFFETGSEGTYPNAEFRVDEARLFVDAAVWGSVYAYAELNLATRESPDLGLELGELYLDFEDVSQLWGQDRQLNARAGRFYVPFGEDYLTRHAIDNPLISHSLPDLWGVDEGVEAYGTLGKFSYVVAVQNGGISPTHDFTADKSVAGRISFDPKRWLHLSVSGMRTGDLNVAQDKLSELWFGNGWFRSLGSAATTSFHANLVEADLGVRLPRGHVKVMGGYVRYDDNDPAADNGRDVYFYGVEAAHDLAGRLYAAARFSRICASEGFPIVGNGSMSEYLFGSLTEDLWRLSLGLGYRWSRNPVIKAEYTIEEGKETGGDRRNHENLVAAEAAFGF